MARWLTLRRRSRTPRVERQPAQVLAPYVGVSWYQRHRRLCLWALGFVCCVYGYLWAIAGQFILTILIVPLGFMFALLVWVLPETGRIPEKWLTRGLFAFLIALLCWPDYIALALPGLPWITMIRLVGAPLAFLFLICLSLSGNFRVKVWTIINAAPILWKCVAGFAVICLLTIALSDEVRESISKFVVAQVNWTSIFFISCVVFSQPGNVRRFAVLLWCVTLFVCLIGLWEFRLGQVPWVGHIPSFLVVQDESVQRSLAVQARGSGVYRVHSKFATSLGLAEFLAVSSPFLMHFFATARDRMTRILAFATLVLIIYSVHLTDSRLAAIGFFVSLALYLLYWAVMKWKNDKNSIVGATVTLGYPVVFALMLAAVFLVPRLRVEVFGDGSQQASTNARRAMYEKGIPMILENPFGHGIGQGGQTLGYFNAGGVLTIDTYYLAVGLEFGVVGFLVYYGMNLYAAGKSALIAYERNDGEFAWLGPVAIAMFNFVVSKSVFSSVENHPLIFALLGVVAALAYRAQATRQPAKPAKQQQQAPQPMRPQRSAAFR